jgi:hypothetical protein
VCSSSAGDDPSAALAFADAGWRPARVYRVVNLDTELKEKLRYILPRSYCFAFVEYKIDACFQYKETK